KARHLACWRSTFARPSVNVSYSETPPTRSALSLASAAVALRHGIRLGLDCARCCGNLMLILLVFGVMAVPVMAVVTAAITLERLAPALLREPSRGSGPAGEPVVHAIGTVAIGAGLLLIARAGRAALGLS